MAEFILSIIPKQAKYPTGDGTTGDGRIIGLLDFWITGLPD
jgi:hypothetical protein